jgi:membrane protein implicated in regulation of membrane protease activity
VDANDPETWRWIWLIAAVAFAIGEMATVGSFFLAPFAVGATVAAVLSFLGVDVGVTWVVFMGVSLVSFLGMRPLSRTLDQEGTALGVGSHRQIGQHAKVVETISADHEGGFVMLGPERWRAESQGDVTIAEGSIVEVLEVRGTRVIVSPVSGPTIDPRPPTA